MPAIRASVRRAACVVLLMPSLVLAQATVPCAEQSAESKRLAKQSYSLSRPTPTTMMREFSSDRPDKTERAYTVDAGRVQVELDMLTFSRDRALDADVENITTGISLDPTALALMPYVALAPNIQLDGGMNVGLTRSADGVSPFLGLAFRF